MGDRLLLLGRFKSHSGLEGRVARLPHTRKHTIPPFEIWQAKMHLNSLSSFWGVAHGSRAGPASAVFKFINLTSDHVMIYKSLSGGRKDWK
jgi:hypothetical protein